MKFTTVLIALFVICGSLLSAQSDAATVTLYGVDNTVYSVSVNYEGGYQFANDIFKVTYNFYSGTHYRGFAEFNLQELYDQGITAASIESVVFYIGNTFHRENYPYVDLYAMTDYEDGTSSNYTQTFANPGTEIYNNVYYLTHTYDVTEYLKDDLENMNQYSGYAMKLTSESGLQQAHWYDDSIQLIITYSDEPPVVVPEPTSILMLIASIVGLKFRKVSK